jgi:hypothetical protein
VGIGGGHRDQFPLEITCVLETISARITLESAAADRNPANLLPADALAADGSGGTPDAS